LKIRIRNVYNASGACPADLPGREIVMTKFRILSLFAVFVLLVSVLVDIPVQAQGSLNVNLYAATDTVKAGDTIALNVNFSMFPHLTRFGPIEVQFDPKYVSFAGMDKGSAMPSTFSVSNSATNDVIAVIGVDQTVEAIAGANQTAATVDEQGNPIPAPADPSMYSDAEVTVCVLYFKVIDTAPSGDANFWLGSIGGFKDSSLAQVTASRGNTVIVPVKSLLSSEASLSQLTIDGAVLAPEFSPSVFEYTAKVTRSISSVEITAAATDPSAQFYITGSDNLIIGDNEITIKVTAQDGKTALEYKINIVRDSSFVPEGASITGSGGVIYSFAEIPDALALPDGFSLQMQMLGKQSVPVFMGNGIKSMLLYLAEGDNSPQLFIYNPDNGSIRPYVSDFSVLIPAELLTVAEVTDDVAVPEGFSKAEDLAGEYSAAGYYSEKKDITLIYLTNETGISRFYTVDLETGEVYPYKDVQTPAYGYLIPFVLVSVFAASELGIIVYIIYQVRLRNRPKEVKRV